MLALQVTIQGANPGRGLKCHAGPGSRFRSIRKGVLGLGDWSLSLSPLIPEGRGTAGGDRNRVPPTREWDSRMGPLLTSQGHRMEQWRGCGTRWAVVWSGRGLVRDAQGLRWGRDSGCEGLGTQEFTGVKLGRTQWSLRCQESEMPPLFLMWVCGGCRGNTEMGTVGRTRFEEKMKAETLNMSRGHSEDRGHRRPQRRRSSKWDTPSNSASCVQHEDIEDIRDS